jgi:vacuolar-type H+-ATPase subunit E/Vma4
VNILEKMLEVETGATQILENAQREADEIRKKAREDAKQLVLDGKKELQERLRQEVAQIEEEATVQKESIFQEAETHRAEMERIAKKRMDQAVDRVMNTLLNER